MRSRTREMVLAALMSALTALLSVFSIPVGPTALTLQTFSAALAGYVLGGRTGCLAVIGYLMLGMCGLPVFSGMTGGPGVLLGPTGGFLLGFPAMAWLCGRGGRGPIAAAAGLGGLAVVYIIGTVWMAAAAGMSIGQSAAVGVVPFIVKDILSVAGAYWLGKVVRRRIERFH